jgi:hypothetical protein
MRCSRHQRMNARTCLMTAGVRRLGTGNAVIDAPVDAARSNHARRAAAGDMHAPSSPIEPTRHLDHLSLGSTRFEARQEDRDRHRTCTSHGSRAQQSQCHVRSCVQSTQRDCYTWPVVTPARPESLAYRVHALLHGVWRRKNRAEAEVDSILWTPSHHSPHRTDEVTAAAWGALRPGRWRHGRVVLQPESQDRSVLLPARRCSIARLDSSRPERRSHCCRDRMIDWRDRISAS